MEGRLARLIDRVKGKKGRELIPAPDTRIAADEALPTQSGMTPVGLSDQPLSLRLFFGQRVDVRDIDPNELARIVEAGVMPLVGQLTLPWEGTPQAEIYTTHTANEGIAQNPGLSHHKARRAAEELRLKEFVEGPQPSLPLRPRINPPIDRRQS